MRLLAMECAACVGSLAAGESPPAIATVPDSFAQAHALPAPNDSHRFEDVFAPFTTEAASISPDGKHLAYSVLDEGLLYVVVVAIDDPGKFLAKVAVNSIKGAQRDGQSGGREVVPPRIFWLGWISPTRLAVLTQVRNGPALMAFDADGANARILATARTRATLGGYMFFSRSTEADAVILRTFRQRPTGIVPTMQGLEFDYVRLHGVTGKFTDIDEATAFEEQRHVRRAAGAAQDDRQAVERDLREILPDRLVLILGNDDAQVRFLALVEGLAQPGSYCVIDRERRVVFDLVSRMPGFKSAAGAVVPFEFTAGEGQKVSGQVMLPRESKVAHAPVVVLMPDRPGWKMLPGFAPEAHAFARMGLASVRFDSFVNVRGRQASREDERRLVGEIVRLVDSLPALHAVSKRSIVLYGQHQAGYMALRALQIAPERFIAAVAVEPAITREGWNDPKLWPENAGKPGGLAGFKRPLLIVTTPAMARPRLAMIHSLIRETKRTGLPAELSEQSMDFNNGRKLARAAGFREIERFINANAYQFTVKLHELEVKP